MQNPWIQLPKNKPYILEMDREKVNNRNAKTIYKIHENLLPEPFLGCPNAPIILLNLNPGWDKHDRYFHRKKDFKTANRKNLTRKQVEYPFYLLNPNLSKSPGYKWWKQRLHDLIEDFGRRTVARKICCMEFSPYHSRNFKYLELPSRKYNFVLVRDAMQNNALIIIMRGMKLWQGAVPELMKYKNKYCLNSSRNVSVTQGNMKKIAYEKLTKILRG